MLDHHYIFKHGKRWCQCHINLTQEHSINRLDDLDHTKIEFVQSREMRFIDIDPVGKTNASGSG